MQLTLPAEAARPARRSVGSRTVAFALAAIAAVLAVAVVSRPSAAATGSTRAATGVQHLTLYSDVRNERYVNNVDDLARGEGHNPLGNFSSVPPPKNEKVSGPFAGDEGLFAFNLYTDAGLKTSAGKVIFLCWYNFDENGFCDASFQLNGGMLIGKGAFSFNASKFALALIGGTSNYRRVTGEVEVSALGSGTQAQPVFRVVPMLQAQRLDFVIRAA
jgi:hypothetical protein